jgi:hypothetical protein
LQWLQSGLGPMQRSTPYGGDSPGDAPRHHFPPDFPPDFHPLPQPSTAKSLFPPRINGPCHSQKPLEASKQWRRLRLQRPSANVLGGRSSLVEVIRSKGSPSRSTFVDAARANLSPQDQKFVEGKQPRRPSNRFKAVTLPEGRVCMLEEPRWNPSPVSGRSPSTAAEGLLCSLLL